MTTTTNVEQVKLNIMTTSQYDNSSKSDTELYVLTDATAMPMDDELSLSSENPVKNNVITARSNQIQSELDDKLNKSTVWNKLNRAYGWTYRHLNGAGNAYFGYYSGDFRYSDSYSAQTIVEDEKGRSGIPSADKYVCIDNQLYYKTYTNSNGIYTFTLTPISENKCSCYVSYGQNDTYCLAIIDNNLYRNSGTNNLTLINSGGWTKISWYENYSSVYSFGIKNDNLYYIYNLTYSNLGTVTLKDSGIWTDVVGYSSSSSMYGFGIREGKLYSLNSSGVTKISDETGWSMICGYDNNVSSTSYCGFGIRDGKLYKLKGNGAFLINNTETWIKIKGRDGIGIGLTQSGKLYRINYETITQIGVDVTWSDITGFYSSNYFAGIKNGDVFILTETSNETFIRLTNMGNITNIYNTFTKDSYSSGVFWTGSVTEDIHNVYTVASPAVGFETYSNTNLQSCGAITSTSLSPYTITDQYYTYTRDSSIDGVFSGISADSAKQLMSMKDFLMCFTE